MERPIEIIGGESVPERVKTLQQFKNGRFRGFQSISHTPETGLERNCGRGFF